MIPAYVESLKLRIGSFVGLAALLGYVATAPAGLSLSAMGILFLATVMAAGGAGALNHFLDRDSTRAWPAPRGGRSRPGGSVTAGISSRLASPSSRWRSAWRSGS